MSHNQLRSGSTDEDASANLNNTSTLPIHSPRPVQPLAPSLIHRLTMQGLAGGFDIPISSQPIHPAGPVQSPVPSLSGESSIPDLVSDNGSFSSSHTLSSHPLEPFELSTPSQSDESNMPDLVSGSGNLASTLPIHHHVGPVESSAPSISETSSISDLASDSGISDDVRSDTTKERLERKVEEDMARRPLLFSQPALRHRLKEFSSRESVLQFLETSVADLRAHFETRQKIGSPAPSSMRNAGISGADDASAQGRASNEENQQSEEQRVRIRSPLCPCAAPDRANVLSVMISVHYSYQGADRLEVYDNSRMIFSKATDPKET